jgi:crotonobetainyl-CoA hydratase
VLVSESSSVAVDAVLVERHGHVMVVTINRPEARNAVDEAVCLGVGDAMEEADRDVDGRVVVLTGAGDKAFCVGAEKREPVFTGR